MVMSRIEKLEELKNNIKTCRKIKVKKKIKNMGVSALVLSPIIVVGCVFGSGWIIKKDMPGRLDNVEKCAYTTVCYSSDSGTSVTKEYREKEASNRLEMADYMNCYGPWIEQGDGTYVSNVTQYELEDMTENQMYELLKDGLSFEDALNLGIKTSKNEKYKTDSLTLEEKEKAPYFEIIVHDRNYDDKIVAMETEEENRFDIAMLEAAGIIALAGEIFMFMEIRTGTICFEETKYVSQEIKKYKKEYKKIKLSENN